MESWLTELTDEDRAFIKRFVLASGSLKALAGQYNVSYPTLRVRLDRLIEKIRALENPRNQDPFRKKIQALAADGQISTAVAKELIQLHEQEKGGTENGGRMV